MSFHDEDPDVPGFASWRQVTKGRFLIRSRATESVSTGTIDGETLFGFPPSRPSREARTRIVPPLDTDSQTRPLFGVVWQQPPNQTKTKSGSGNSTLPKQCRPSRNRAKQSYQKSNSLSSKNLKPTEISCLTSNPSMPPLLA